MVLLFFIVDGPPEIPEFSYYKGAPVLLGKDSSCHEQRKQKIGKKN